MPDAYTRRARLLPAVLAGAGPIGIFAGGLLTLQKAEGLVGFLLMGATFVVCGLVRERGRSIESSLWISWGGAPTTNQLRWSGPASTEVQTRRHGLLERILGEPLPDAVEEVRDPGAADRRYEVATAALRELTRDQDRFPLVAEENREYGFRRNCLGLKPLALFVCLVAVAASVGFLVASDSVSALIGLGVSVVALVFWLVVVGPEWVQSAARLYADRLLETSESLG